VTFLPRFLALPEFARPADAQVGAALAVFTLRVAYKERFFAQLVAFVTGAIILIMLASDIHKDTSIFVYLNLIFWQNCAIIVTFRNDRIYILDENSATYSFVVGQRSCSGTYHNIYIRLSKENTQGQPLSSITPPQYHLVLDGVKIDQQRITKCSCSDLKLLRKLGQKLAKNLNINYFDEANVSVFHNVRHWPADKGAGGY